MHHPVHFRVRARPACKPNADVSYTLPSNTTFGHPDDVTCRACLKVMAAAVRRLTPRKSKR